MGGLAKADKSRHVAHRDARLLDQQLGGHIQPARLQLLVEPKLTALREGACELAR